MASTVLHPLTNLNRQKKKKKLKKKKVSFSNEAPRQFTAIPDSGSEITPFKDLEDPSVSQNMISSIKEKLQNQGKKGWVAIVAAAMLVLFFVVRVIRSKASPEKQVALVEPVQEEQMVQQEVQLETQRAELTKLYNSLLSHRNNIIAQVTQNKQHAAHNQEQFSNMFAAKKSSYDESIASFEEEQSFDKAFMLKDDLDQKKQEMIKQGEDLGKHHSTLIDQLRQIDMKLSDTISFYNANYDNPLPDPRGAPPQQQANQQRQAMDMARNDYNNNQRQHTIKDGTGREMLPN